MLEFIITILMGAPQCFTCSPSSLLSLPGLQALDVRALGSSATFCLGRWRDRVVVQDVITVAKPGCVAASLETDVRFWTVRGISIRWLIGAAVSRAIPKLGLNHGLDPWVTVGTQSKGITKPSLDNRLTLRRTVPLALKGRSMMSTSCAPLQN